jgi:hypothetical protein
MEEYKRLAKLLLEGRENNTLSEQDEDIILDKMDYLWYRMTEKEMNYLNNIDYEEYLKR